MMIESKIKIGILGLGYAGFPIACLFSQKYDVVGFDISAARVAELNAGKDHCGDVSGEEIRAMLDRGAILTTDIEALRPCNFYVIVVPTPVDKHYRPDVSFLKTASREVGSVLGKGDVVVFESTVYPGATEEICIPAIEDASGLICNQDFFVGYSPERINPGDKLHTPGNVVKVTSGSTPEAAAYIDEVYASVLGKDHTWRASSIRVAEASKVIENTQRDVNIAFMNEVAQILNAFDIDTNEVIDAMDTKWNALGFRPGLVGGHCIGVDPYYLIERAATKGISAGLMSLARTINNSMPGFVTEKVMQLLKMHGKDTSKSSVLLLGFTFKENCPDIRNTKISDIYRLLKDYTDDITIYDPWVDSELAQSTYGYAPCTQIEQLGDRKFDAIILCVAHDCFATFDLEKYGAPGGVIYDVKGFFAKAGIDSDIIEEI